ncbi:MAG: PAS domain-containing protein [Desulfotomaculales bacterium]
MAKLPGSKSILPLFTVMFFLSLITGFFVLQFRLVSRVVGEYESALKQTALRKIELYVNEVRAVAEDAARQLERDRRVSGDALRDIARRDRGITAAYLVRPDGSLIDPAAARKDPYHLSLVLERARAGETFITGGAWGWIMVGTPVYGDDRRPREVLVLEIASAPFLRELAQEFFGETYKIALLDDGRQPVVWPFAEEQLEEFSAYQDKFYDHGTRYIVGAAGVDHTSWQVCFFVKDSNFDAHRIITIMFLLFALYFCIYEFLAGFLKARSINSYFEDVNFAIFNHLQEGIIICNKFDRIVFANEAAHRFFAGRKPELRGAALQDVLGPTRALMSGESKKMVLKDADRVLEIVYSPIFKEGRVLGSLVVIGRSGDREKTAASVLAHLFEVSREGLIYVDKNHQVAMANMMAKCYLGPLEKGTHINEVNSRLAAAVYDNIGSRSLNKVHISLSGVTCEIAAVYDDDGLYAGTLVFLRDAAAGPLAEGI